MSMRGGGEGRGRTRPHGSKNKQDTQPNGYTAYKPGPDVYEGLFRLQREPPVIVRTLPKECPIPGAQSSILSRRPVEGFSRYYYNVRIVYDVEEGSDEREGTEAPEEVAQVEMSQILKYVSRWELERYEQQDFRQQAEAEEVARRVEAEELAKRRLEKNAREPGMGRGMENGDTQVRARGRPRGRGRGRGRARGWLGRGGLAAMADQTLDVDEVQQQLTEQAIMDTSGDEETEEEGLDLLSKQPSPNLARSSFITQSALPLSPVARHRLSKVLVPAREPYADEESYPIDDYEDGQDTRSMSSAAAQLQFEGDNQEEPARAMDEESGDDSDELDEADRHRIKRPRNESSPPMPESTSRRTSAPFPMPKTHSALSWSKQYVANSHLHSDAQASEPNDSGADSDHVDEHPRLARQPASDRRGTAVAGTNLVPPHDHDKIDEDDMVEDQDEEEYVVDAILSHSYAYKDGKKHYLVRWEGDEDSSDWIAEEDLAGAKELVAEYNERIGRGKAKATWR
ncbi:hypothetical protein BU23DRAFT_553656 [Bimuria novae-zelandiae CBS 107.79]|uniref:Chromo domain-containing protein n=1 Tax=Bimuria novae-zelandiae CBS 107.79 TaxID=1447943 RepID=A0A6A5VA13_9PLEO|nr:hypothetical protein BU23DRAFT_553656 [Bimuria novae-zelandiae CBS 107.79]